MAQTAKMIDIKRTYVPIDPRAFPETLHTSYREESPENNIPVVAFDGYNFMPTSYGYRSYFGINEALDALALVARADVVFVYQTATLKNVMVALTHDGIWYKDGTIAGGAWTHPVTYPVSILPEDEQPYYPWTTCVLDNNIYVYQQGRASFYKIHTSGGTAAFEEMTPNFLNMAGQVGIFRAGNRLGFWDTDNSVAWSNLDDVEDFTPSTTTLAGSTKFADVQGTIVTIKSHGAGFIVYATKSIVHINKEPSSLFQWIPSVVMNDNGIAYPRQVAIGIPDTLQFAYTSNGIWKIENGRGEVIVPEVYDFLEDTEGLKYLKLLQGRYLFIELFDDDLLIGRTPFTEAIGEDVTVTLPGVNITIQDAVKDALLQGDNICVPIKQNGNFSGQAILIPDMKPGTTPEPEYTCYLRMPIIAEAGDITYSSTPCSVTFNSETIPMSPEIGGITDFSSVYKAVDGADAWVDGTWTITRFVQVQTALWELDNSRLAAWHAALNGKGVTRQYKVPAPTMPTPDDVTRTECYGIEVPAGFIGPFFGWNPCSFWLTRYAIGTKQVVTVKATNAVGEDTLKAAVPWWACSLGVPGLEYTSAAQAHAEGAANAIGPFVPYEGVVQFFSGNPSFYYRSIGSYKQPGFDNYLYIYEIYAADSSSWTLTGSWPAYQQYRTTNRYNKVFNLNAYNDLRDKNYGVYPDTAYCELKGYKYTKNDDTPGFHSVASCANETSDIDGSQNRTVPINGPTLKPADKDGELCSIPFEPVTIDGTPAVTVTWPDQTIVYPGSNFILREGTTAPLYPEAKGAYVYDLHLKKWGKMKQDYQHLLDYSPLNSNANDIVPMNTFGIRGGVFMKNGEVRLFDNFPLTSRITYGKIGYDRLYHTSVEEIRVDFKGLSTGTLRVETSVTGRNVNTGISKSVNFEEVDTVTLYGGFPGKWHQISIEGYFDISYMEFRGTRHGRR